MHVLDPLERSFAFREAGMFRDMETGEQLTTLPWQIRRAYQSAMGDFIERYKRECRENLVDYLALDTHTPFDVALVEYLSKRTRLY
jgi:hypothetical protein